jgi:pullulanase/glycogen debranching enzyme
MIQMGDEVRRTQMGNNNGYCRDDPSVWFDWTLLKKHSDIHRFVSLLAGRRTLRDLETERHHLSLNTFLRDSKGLARRQAECAGLERLVAQPGTGRRASARGRAVPHHAECLPGAAQVRAPGPR